MDLLYTEKSGRYLLFILFLPVSCLKLCVIVFKILLQPTMMLTAEGLCYILLITHDYSTGFALQRTTDILRVRDDRLLTAAFQEPDNSLNFWGH